MSDAGEPIELSDDERRTIDAIYERRLTATHYELLGVARDADRRAIRDAYFALSQRFHPDVFFKRSLGEYRARIDELFRVLTRAYDVLGNARQRAGYDLHLASLESPSRPPPAVPEVQDIVAANARKAASTQPTVPAVPGSQPGVRRVGPTPPPAASHSAPPPPAAPNPPPPARTPPRPVMPPIGTAVVPLAPAVTPPAATAPVAPPPSAKVTPAVPLQPLDPETLRRARESMARRLSSAMPSGPRPPGGAPSRSAPPAPLPPAPSSNGQVPQVDKTASVAQLVSTAEEAQKKGDFAAAAEALKQALAMKKDDEALRLRYEAMRKLVVTQQVDAHINQARDAMREGQALAAAQHWERAWEGRPTDFQLLLNAADIVGKYTRDYKRATDLAQRVVMSEPNNVKAHVLLATVFLKAGLKASARASIETVMRLDPQHPSLKELREKFGPMNLAEQLGLRNR